MIKLLVGRITHVEPENNSYINFHSAQELHKAMTNSYHLEYGFREAARRTKGFEIEIRLFCGELFRR